MFPLRIFTENIPCTVFADLVHYGPFNIRHTFIWEVKAYIVIHSPTIPLKADGRLRKIARWKVAFKEDMQALKL
ncbi:hypothetical protein DEDE109153_10745 [Deinococcus deserti]